MAEKRRFTVSLPEHVSDEVHTFAAALDSNPSEYIALIVRDWFARGCPPITAEERTLRERKQQTPPESARRAG